MLRISFHHDACRLKFKFGRVGSFRLADLNGVVNGKDRDGPVRRARLMSDLERWVRTRCLVLPPPPRSERSQYGNDR